jgi:hypothetical protein
VDIGLKGSPTCAGVLYIVRTCCCLNQRSDRPSFSSSCLVPSLPSSRPQYPGRAPTLRRARPRRRLSGWGERTRTPRRRFASYRLAPEQGPTASRAFTRIWQRSSKMPKRRLRVRVLLSPATRAGLCGLRQADRAAALRRGLAGYFQRDRSRRAVHTPARAASGGPGV